MQATLQEEYDKTNTRMQNEIQYSLLTPANWFSAVFLIAAGIALEHALQISWAQISGLSAVAVNWVNVSVLVGIALLYFLFFTAFFWYKKHPNNRMMN